MVAGVFFVAAVVVVGLSRLAFNLQAGSGSVCTATNPQDAVRWLGPDETIIVSEKSSDAFTTRNPCWASKIGVEKGMAYRLRIDINPDDLWFDRAIMTDVGGFENDGLLRKFLRWPLLRWPLAGWFHPIARIGATGDDEWPIVANDGSGPIPDDAGGCKLMPRSYLDTPEFCKAHEPLPCTDARKEMERALDDSQRLPVTEMASAKKAWLKIEGRRRLSAFQKADCKSSYRRMNLVSDFVAKRTGELFLFVNDAMPFMFMPTGEHYVKNSGSAKITLSRVPVSDFKTLISRRDP